MEAQTVDRSAQTKVDRKPAVAPAKLRTGYFTVVPALLFAFVLVGFSRTFFLRPFSELPPLSGPLHVHGAVLTAWYAFLLLQALLVRSRKVGFHRRLGVAGAVVALGVVAASSWILALRDAPYVEEAPGRGFGNLMSLVAFALCVGSALWLRRRPPAHRRLMLLGSIVIVAPALSRIFYAPAGTSGPATAIATIALLLTLVVHDLLEQRKPHWATLSGLALIFLFAPGITFALIETGVWPGFVRFVS